MPHRNAGSRAREGSGQSRSHTRDIKCHRLEPVQNQVTGHTTVEQDTQSPDTEEEKDTLYKSGEGNSPVTTATARGEREKQWYFLGL